MGLTGISMEGVAGTVGMGVAAVVEASEDHSIPRHNLIIGVVCVGVASY